MASATAVLPVSPEPHHDWQKFYLPLAAMIFAVRTAIGFSFRLEVALYEPFIDDIIVPVGLVLSFGLGVF